MSGNDLDELMSRDPLDLSSQDIDKLVDYLRGSYKTHEQGAKFKRTGAEADKPKLDLGKLGLAKAAEVPQIKRRTL